MNLRTSSSKGIRSLNKSVSEAHMFALFGKTQSRSSTKKGFEMNMLSPEMKPMNNQNYVSIMKRKDMADNLLRQKSMHFSPKMIGGKIGSLLELKQEECGTPLIQIYKGK